MIDQLKLFRGEGYKINDKILIRQPTLEEIVDFGEQRYFGLVRTICSTPADRKVEIWDKLHVFWEKIDEYDLFISLFQTLQKSDYRHYRDKREKHDNNTFISYIKVRRF